MIGNNIDPIIIKNDLKRPAWLVIPKDVERHDWAGSGWNQWFVPDYICFVSIKKSAYIHDRMYETGYPKDLCDKVFYFNMLQQIKKDCSLILKPSAIATAKTYYWAVVNHGWESYNKCLEDLKT
jgi:hypothetical protein